MKRITILLIGNQLELSLKEGAAKKLQEWFENADDDNVTKMVFDDGSTILLRRSEVVALTIINQ